MSDHILRADEVGPTLHAEDVFRRLDNGEYEWRRSINHGPFHFLGVIKKLPGYWDRMMIEAS